MSSPVAAASATSVESARFHAPVPSSDPSGWVACSRATRTMRSVSSRSADTDSNVRPLAVTCVPDSRAVTCGARADPRHAPDTSKVPAGRHVTGTMDATRSGCATCASNVPSPPSPLHGSVPWMTARFPIDSMVNGESSRACASSPTVPCTRTSVTAPRRTPSVDRSPRMWGAPREPSITPWKATRSASTAAATAGSGRPRRRNWRSAACRSWDCRSIEPATVDCAKPSASTTTTLSSDARVMPSSACR